MTDLIIKALLEGGPFAIGVIGWFAWYYERRVNREYSLRLFELATAQVEAAVKYEAAIQSHTRLMERFLK